MSRTVTPAAALRKFFRTPKGLLILILGALAALAAPVEGFDRVGPTLAAAAIAAMLVDAPILRWRTGAWEFPSGALLTGLFVAMLLSPLEPWWVAAVTAVVGVVSKYVLRTKSANIFNPAAVAIVATFYVFDTGQSWWGALPDLAPWMTVILLATGAFITDRVNKMPLVLVFLGTYYLLFSVTAFVGSPVHVAEIFRAPDVQMALFFAFFILTDPPTSPVKYPDQIICGAIVAVVSFAVFEWVGAAYYLLAGVLVGNVWEAWRRVQARARRTGRQPLQKHQDSALA
ncbi:MAG: RnfABCDGE type electron transport complex subunit D [Acidobacteriota bacterium]